MAVKYILKSQNRYKMWKNTEGKLKKNSLLSSNRVTAQYESKTSSILLTELPN